MILPVIYDLYVLYQFKNFNQILFISFGLFTITKKLKYKSLIYLILRYRVLSTNFIQHIILSKVQV